MSDKTAKISVKKKKTKKRKIDAPVPPSSKAAVDTATCSTSRTSNENLSANTDKNLKEERSKVSKNEHDVIKPHLNSSFSSETTGSIVVKNHEVVKAFEAQSLPSICEPESSERKDGEATRVGIELGVPSVDVSAVKSKADLKAERRALQEAQRAAKTSCVEKEASTGTLNDGATVTTKSKAELRAERRALQEAQRAAKTSGVVKPTAAKNKPSSEISAGVKNDFQKGTRRDGVLAAATKPTESTAVIKTTTKQIKLFSHLPPYKRDVSVLQAVKDEIHPAIVQLGLKYAEGVICGSNARCVALIIALQKVISDFRTPKNKEISHALPEMILDPSMSFLENCRPVSVGMKNVAKKLREEIINLDKQLTEDDAKEQLDDFLRTFRTDSIEKAHEAIVNLAKDKITSNDIILTYGSSYVVKQVLIAAHKNAKFRVIVVDSRPKLEGRKMFEYLIREGIKCSYILINAVSYAMQEATKVLLGAHALLANGYVMSRVGSSQVALVAKAYNKPVLVCCETYKFCELVQTDSFVVNELGDPNDLVVTSGRTNPLEGWVDVQKLNILNPYYDVTPPDLVTVVINDVCLVPCTSVPVLLRVRPAKK